MKNEEILGKIEKAVIGCKKCRLYRGAKNAVPGCGDSGAKIVFIGEAPGFNEDQQGKPFVGRAGKLLDDLLKSVKIERSEVWIGNIIKHRPPENRDPMVDEVRNCAPFLEEQLKVLKPKVIVTLGRISLEYFIKEAKISERHGSAILYKDKVYFPLYHPAAALRNPNIEKILREDFKKLPKVVRGDTLPVEMGRTKEKDKHEGQIGLL